jgi:hypothetical protein
MKFVTVTFDISPVDGCLGQRVSWVALATRDSQ